MKYAQIAWYFPYTCVCGECVFVLPFYLFCCLLLHCQAEQILLGTRLKACNSFWQQADNSQLGIGRGSNWFQLLLRCCWRRASKALL